MSLVPVDAEFHYVQSSAPSSANAGDVWLDTSQNPPVAKVYADVGSGLEWLVDQSSDRIASNLDAPVSEAGQGVDWASKTTVIDAERVTDADVINISGAGYLLHLEASNTDAGSRPQLDVSIDGTNVLSNDLSPTFGATRLDGSHSDTTDGRILLSGPIRFESSIVVSGSNNTLSGNTVVALD